MSIDPSMQLHPKSRGNLTLASRMKDGLSVQKQLFVKIVCLLCVIVFPVIQKKVNHFNIDNRFMLRQENEFISCDFLTE